MESLFKSEKPAALTLGGIPSEEEQTVRYGIRIPYLLSFLAHGNIHEEVKGLDQFPRENWPPVAVTHFSFQIMVALGTFLATVGMASLFSLFTHREWLQNRCFLFLLAACAPLGFLAIETGWIVTELGRQPWIIYGIMKTKEAVTSMPGLVYPMSLFTGIYLFLSFAVSWLMVRQFRDVS